MVKDAANWKKWWSMRFIIATTLFASISVAYAGLPEDWLPAIPSWLKFSLAVGTMATAAAAGVSRVINQPKLHQDQE